MKNNFLKSTIILLIGGFLTKILGLIIKIIFTRILKSDGISLYSFIIPTYSLLMTIANFNIQLSVSKRISSYNRSKKTIINSCYIMFILDLIIVISMFFLTKPISLYLLKNKDTYYPLLACSLTLPFISIGYIIKGYFYGKQNVTPHMISNVLEQILRLIIISYFLPKLIKYGKIIMVTSLILLNIITETFSILILLIFLPKKFNIKKTDLSFDKSESLEICRISIPSITGRIIANIGYFLEPILLTNILLLKGFKLSFITKEYGIYNAYAISTLLFPSFFISAISNSLLPEISKLYTNKNYKLVKKRIKEAITLSLAIGITCTLFIFIFSNKLLYFLYGNNLGTKYIKLLSPFFILFYLESPLATTLTALNKIKTCTYISISGIIIKLLSMIILMYLGFNIYSLVISEIINIVYITILDYISLKKVLNDT